MAALGVFFASQKPKAAGAQDAALAKPGQSCGAPATRPTASRRAARATARPAPASRRTSRASAASGPTTPSRSSRRSAPASAATTRPARTCNGKIMPGVAQRMTRRADEGRRRVRAGPALARAPACARPMDAVVGALALYPLKGAGGIALDAAEVRDDRPRARTASRDREWMAVDARRRLRHAARAAAPRARRHRRSIGGRLVLSAPHLDADRPRRRRRRALARTSPCGARTCAATTRGDAPPTWLSAAIGADVRVVRFDRAASAPLQSRLRAATPARTCASPTAIRCWSSDARRSTHLNERLAAKGDAPRSR